MPATIYGIKNCDTMKKARAWLDQHGIECDFHDYKTAGIARERLERWAKIAPVGKRCSTTPAPRSATCPIARRTGSPKRRPSR